MRVAKSDRPRRAESTSRTASYRFSCRHGQREMKEGTTPFLRFARDGASQTLDDQPHEVQTESGAFRIDGVRVVRAEELFEQPFLGVWRDADAAVANRPEDRAALRAHPDLDPPLRRRVLNRVRCEIQYHLPNQLAIEQHFGDVVFTLDVEGMLLFAHEHRDVREDAVGQFANAYRLERELKLSAFEARCVEQIVDKPDQTVRRLARIVDVRRLLG